MGKRDLDTRNRGELALPDTQPQPDTSAKGHSSTAAGHLKIRVYHTQRGRPAANITIPIEIMEKFGWQPGMYLSYYPTKGRELVLVSQDQLMVHVSPDYDLSLTPKGKPMPQARRGSMAEREMEVDRSLEKMTAQLTGRGAVVDDADDDGEAMSIDDRIREMEMTAEERADRKSKGMSVGEWFVEKKRRKASGEPLKNKAGRLKK